MTREEFRALPIDERLLAMMETDAQALEDRATGEAFRRLVEQDKPFYVSRHGGEYHLELGWDGFYHASTLPEAVFKALGPVGTCAPVDGLPSAT